MPLARAWCKIWIYFGFVFAWTKGARPRFDTSADMGLVLVPADAEVDSVIFRLRATDQDADFPLVFEITATITPVVRIDNLPCTLYNKVCQANVILTKRLVPGRLHDFAVRVKDTKGDSNSMQATISVTNATTPRDKIFPHIPSLIMVPEDTKPGKELDYLLVRANSWSGKPVYIELWQPKELFTIRQRQTPTQTRGIITLIGELDFETQSMYTLTMYATDPYTEPGKDTRNIAGLNVVVVVQDVQDVPPIFTLAPPLTRINNSVQPGDIVLRVHAEDGDKGVPREIVYGLVSEGNPFTPFFNISETSGEIILARPLEELTQITHVGAPVVLTIVAEELRRTREEPPAQATVVDVGFLLGEPGNSPPYFESDNYIATIDENPEPGTTINFGEQYTTRVKDEDIGKAGVFALKLDNNNGTFEINPTVAERTADFIITVRDNTLIDYELYKSLTFKIVAQEVGPATNLSAAVPVTIFLKDVNDNPPVFEEASYEVTLSENVTAESRVVQVHATDKDTGIYGSIQYTRITGEGSEAFAMDPDTGLITVAIGSTLDREAAEKLILSVEARDENGNGNSGVTPLIVNLLDVNDNAPVFEKDAYEFMLNAELTNFTSPTFIQATDADADPPNNIVRYEIVHGNYENKFYLNETSGELVLRSPITKIRRKKQSTYTNFAKKNGKEFGRNQGKGQNEMPKVTPSFEVDELLKHSEKRTDETELIHITGEVMKKIIKKRRKRANEDALYTLTARAYDLGVPHLSSVTQIRIISGIAMEARIMMFVVPGEHPDSAKTAETLATITGGRVTVLETRPYFEQNQTGSTNLPEGAKRSIIVARVEQTEPGTLLVDVDKIRKILAANGVGIISGADTVTNATIILNVTKAPVNEVPRNNGGQITNINNTITSVQSEEVTVYKAENKLLLWLLIILGLLMLIAIATLIICCICPGCPFYMAPRKRRVHSSETLVVRADGRPKRHLYRQPAAMVNVTWNGRKQAWSADPTRRNWQFNKRNIKNCGLSSLPGDVAYISNLPNDTRMNVEAPRLRDDPTYNHSRRSRLNEQERMYMEDIEGQKIRGYGATELDSLQRHDMERGSDMQRQSYRQRSDPRYIEADVNEETSVREQHFYREGNAEVLRLVTRGQIEETASHHHVHHHPTTLIVDGKDIILQRFIEDQKMRHELSMQDIEAARSMESHQQSQGIGQQQPPEIILIPDRLEIGLRQHVEELGPNVQRLVIDHGDYGSQKMKQESQIKDTMKHESFVGESSMTEKPSGVAKEHVQSTNTEFSFHDVELARQNALLTRLLLERENRHAGGGMVDSTSYLETQSLPGQVAIATQTDRTTATQTERQVRSRSDNDDSDEDTRQKKKLKSRKKYNEADWKRSRTLWMKSPIEEEGSPCFDKRLSILRRKVREVKEGRNISLEPEVLKEISDSLDGNGSSYNIDEDEKMKSYRKSIQQTSIRYKVLNDQEDGSPSSEEACTNKDERTTDKKLDSREVRSQVANVTESTSSPEIKMQREKHSRERTEEKSPTKAMKSKVQKKSDGVIKPSFKILEKEFTMLTKKLSKLGDRKFHESTGSDSTSQEKSESLSKESKKKLDTSNIQGQKQTTEITSNAPKTEQKGAQKKDTATIAKTKQKLKYQQSHVMSTGSSEYDDGSDKLKQQSLTKEMKQKQTSDIQSHSKVKRQMVSDRKNLKKQLIEFRDDEIEKKKDGIPKEASKTESRTEKVGKIFMRAPKLAALQRKENVSEEFSSSINSNGTSRKKNASVSSDPEKKGDTDSSEKMSNHVHRQRDQPVASKVIQRFSDDFVDESKPKDTAAVLAAKGQRADNVEKKETVRKEMLTSSSSSTSTNNRIEKKEVPVEQSTKREDRAVSKEIGEVSHDVAQQLIQSCGVFNTRQTREEKIIEGNGRKDRKSPQKILSKTEYMTTNLDKGNEKTVEELTNIESVRKENEKSGTERSQSKDIIAKETAGKVQDKLETYIEECKLLEHGDERIGKTEHVLEEHQEINKGMNVDADSSMTLTTEGMAEHSEENESKNKKELELQVIQKLSKMKDVALEKLKEAEHKVAQKFIEKKNMLIEKFEKEIDHKTTRTYAEQNKASMMLSDIKPDRTLPIENEGDVKSKQIVERERLSEISGSDSIGPLKEAEKSPEKNSKIKPMNETKDIKQNLQDELRDHERKEKLLEIKEPIENIKGVKVMSPDYITESEKKDVTDIEFKDREKQGVNINAISDVKAKEATTILKTDDDQIKESVILDEKQSSNVEKEIHEEIKPKDVQIAKSISISEHETADEKNMETMTDDQQMDKKGALQEESLDIEKKTSENHNNKEVSKKTESDNHETSQNNNFFRSIEENAAVDSTVHDFLISKETVSPVKEEKVPVDASIDNCQIKDGQNIFLDGTEKASVQIATDKTDKKDHTCPLKKEAPITKQSLDGKKKISGLEENQSTIACVDESKEYSSIEKETDTLKDTGNSKQTGQKDITSDKDTKKIFPEVQTDSPPKIIEKAKDIPEISEKDVEEKVRNILKTENSDDSIKDDDNTNCTKDDSPQTRTSNEQHSLENKICRTESGKSDSDIGKETLPKKPDMNDQTSKESEILLETVIAVQSLVDKIKGDNELQGDTTEIKDIEQTSQSQTKVPKEEVSLLHLHETNKTENDIQSANKFSDLQVDNQLINIPKEENIKANIDDTKEDREKGTILTDENNKTAEDVKSDIVKEQKEKPIKTENADEQSEIKTETMPEIATTKTNELKEADKSPFDETKSVMKQTTGDKETVGKGNVSDDKVEEPIQSTIDETTNLSDNKTTDHEIMQTRGKKEEMPKPLTEVGNKIEEIELAKTSTLVHEAPKEDKSTSDSILSETLTDSAIISIPKKQLEPDKQHAESQGAGSFIEKQTFSTEEGKIELSPEKKSYETEDVSTISQDELNKQDATEAKMDKSLTLEENTTMDDKSEEVEDFTEVSLPLFSNVVDTMDDSDDSDSSSDISRKTTLTTRPYQTPRHHNRQSPEKESVQVTEISDTLNMEDEEDASLTIEVMDDERTEFSKDEEIDVEVKETENIDDQQPFSTELIKAMNDENVEVNKQIEPSVSTHIPFSTEKIVDSSNLKSIQKEKLLGSKSGSETEKESSNDAKGTKDEKLNFNTKAIHRKEPTLSSKFTKSDTSKSDDTKTTEKGKKRILSQRKKKSSSEESSEEKATVSQNKVSHPRQRFRKQPSDDQSKQRDSYRGKESKKTDSEPRRKQSISKSSSERDKKSSSSGEKHSTPPKTSEIDTSKAQPKYMAWYKKNREDMEKKRAELMATDDEDQLPRWLRRSMRNQKSDKNERKMSSQKSSDTTPRTRRKVKPLVNVESEQLKAIVRQGRKLRKAEGGKNEDPPVQIFASVPPAPQPETKHHLVQHSEYKYEKIPAPFYLHPPPAPHPSPQLSPQHFDTQQTMEHGHVDEDFDSGIAISLQSGNRLRHQQLLEKKSVFDIAYNEAAPSQLRSDSTTPPS